MKDLHQQFPDLTQFEYLRIVQGQFIMQFCPLIKPDLSLEDAVKVYMGYQATCIPQVRAFQRLSPYLGPDCMETHFPRYIDTVIDEVKRFEETYTKTPITLKIEPNFIPAIRGIEHYEVSC